MVKSMVKNHANLSFQILPEFFSGKSFMQWAPGVQLPMNNRNFTLFIMQKLIFDNY